MLKIKAYLRKGAPRPCAAKLHRSPPAKQAAELRLIEDEAQFAWRARRDETRRRNHGAFLQKPEKTPVI